MLTPSAPFEMQKAEGAKWWKGKSKEMRELANEPAGRELIKVLSGEEELANLKTPKVRRYSE